MLRGKWNTATIESGQTLSNEVNLQTGYDTLFDTLLVMIPTIDECKVNIQASDEAGGTFRDLYLVEGDGTNCKVMSDLGTGNFVWNIPLNGLQFIKIQTTVAQTEDRTFRVCGVQV